MYIHLLSFSFSPTVQFLFRFFRLFTGTSLLFLSLKITCLAQSVKAINKSTGSKYFASNPFIRSFMNQKMSTVLSPSSDTTFNSKLESLHFDNRNLRNLPVDTGSGNISRATPNVIFSTVKLQPVKNPKLICISPDALRLLGLPYKEQNMLSEEEVAKIERYLSGNELIPGSELAAHCYCGHQFGNFAGQLGDGAAMYLGEIISDMGYDQSESTPAVPASESEAENRWEVQLKGAGLTPYSRTADGRKVLRSSVREFLCSEAMHYLNIPTTRAGSVITSDSTVERDPFYDGNSIDERCTIVSRIAPNFFRFGSFEIFKSADAGRSRAGPSAGNHELKKRLLDHILTYYPSVRAAEQAPSELLREVVKRTAELVAKWQAVGWVHGVLNTDNMSIMGVTIDYGPYGFMEHYDAEYVPNGSDNSGRYCYQAQPQICKWNLEKLAEILAPHVSPTEATSIIASYDLIYDRKYYELMARKLGFTSVDSDSTSGSGSGPSMELKDTVTSLLESMSATYADYTDTFQALTDFISDLSTSTSTASDNTAMITAIDKIVSRCATPDELVSLLQRKIRIHRLSMHPQQLMQLLDLLEQQPDVVVEMYGGAPLEIVKGELMTEKKKYDKLSNTATLLHSLKEKLEIDKKQGSSTTSDQKRSKDRVVWQSFLAKYSQKIKIIRDNGGLGLGLQTAKASSPTFILRNWVAQEAIAAAEKGDYTKVQTVMSMLTRPYTPEYSVFARSSTCAAPSATMDVVKGDVYELSEAEMEFIQAPPNWADSLLCTCSS